MKYLLLTLFAVAGYLAGGLNPAIELSKAVFHEDIRQKGSGNPGFTNFKRVYGNGAASWAVLLLDMAKTALPIAVFSSIMAHNYGMWQLSAAAIGFACMLGHAFPVWYGFKGGKSFIAGFMTVCFTDWRVGLIFLAVFMLLLFTVKYMSVASMAATALYPILLPIFGCGIVTEVFAVCAAALVIFRHKANIIRLRKGTESKFSLSGKKK